MKLLVKANIFIITVLMVLSCEEFNWDLDEKPLIENVEINDVNSNSCQVSVDLKLFKSKNIGSDVILQLQFFKDTNDYSVLTLLKDQVNIGSNIFDVFNLESNTAYYLKVNVRNKVGESQSEFIHFYTLNTGGIPSVSTLGSNSIASNSATLLGKLNNIGNSQVLSKGFCYSLSNNPTTSNSVISVPGVSIGNFSAEVSGLLPNTTYFFRSFATNSNGVAYGDVLQFQTTSGLPSVSTLGSNSITSNAATLLGKLNNIGNGQVLSKGFCYSLSNNPSTSNTVISVPGSSVGNFSSEVSGLLPNTTYFFRAFATNSYGVAYGEVLQFQTSSPNLVIGQNYQGGIIAYLDPSGIHGIIAAPYDQSLSSPWGCQGSNISGAEGSGFGEGYQNTIDITMDCNNVYIAARICSDLVLNGFNDWYLPSWTELNYLFNNRSLIGGFITTGQAVGDCWYWSSTEVDADYAKFINFGNGFDGNYYKQFGLNVRAVRKF